MSQTRTIADTMELVAREAASLAQSSAGQKLDFSEESIKIVESILGQLHSEKKNAKASPQPEVINRVCHIYGAYIGEVMRRNIGGEWILDDKLARGQKIPAMRKGQMQTSPFAKVYKRIMNGPEDDVWFYYRVFVERCAENIPPKV